MSIIQDSVRKGLLRPLKKIGLQLAQVWPFPVWARLKNGGHMYVDLRSTIGRGIFMTGEFDPAVYDALAAVMKPGDVFVDAGTNVGYYTFNCLKNVGPEGEIHCFEIDSRPLNCLRKTINRLEPGNVFLHERAISDQDGEIFFTQAPDSGHSHISDDTSGVRVLCTTLDSWRESLGNKRVAAIKMDLEGAELKALAGAKRILTEDKPAIVCEALGEEEVVAHGVSVRQFMEVLEPYGYTYRTLDNVWSPTMVAVHKGA